MALWSVIIYGRTKEADFRFLAIPEDFTPEDRYWASKYIHGSTVYPEKLKENPRWSLFKNHKHCVIGVTCMVKDLIGSDRRYDYMTEDASRRSIYIFVGYVVKIDRYFTQIINYDNNYYQLPVRININRSRRNNIFYYW
ncbi:MAG: hypothetical protein F6K39_24870 [Okeania sp. SIO3B3]|nr:hypothetical protein [Okeania sp. SIO3B3]